MSLSVPALEFSALKIEGVCPSAIEARARTERTTTGKCRTAALGAIAFDAICPIPVVIACGFSASHVIQDDAAGLLWAQQGHRVLHGVTRCVPRTHHEHDLSRHFQQGT